jgi:hypothetical protein
MMKPRGGANCRRAVGITPFHEQPAAAPLFHVRRLLTGGLERINAESDLLGIEQYLAGGASKTRSNKLRQEERAARLRAELGRDTAPTVQPPGEMPPEVERALAVLNDEAAALKGPPKPAARMALLQDIKVIVEEAIRAVDAQLEELRRSLAYEQAVRLQKRHGALLLQLFRAAQQFSEKAAEEHLLRAAFTGAAYPPRWDLLPAPGVLGAILVLGRETEWESQLSEYRRFLEQRGLL